MNETKPKPKSIFHSYTLPEAEETARIWAGIALLAGSGGIALSAMAVRGLAASSYYPDPDIIWSSGVVAGAASIGSFVGLAIELRSINRAMTARKAYKKEHPELFDSAGDEKK